MRKMIVGALLLGMAGFCQAQSNIYEVNGNVGIGTSTPSSLLEVNGKSKFKDIITIIKPLGAETDNVSLSIPRRNTAIQFSYATLGETGNGASTILGNNIIPAGSSYNSVMTNVNGSDPASFIRLNYMHGISFHTGIEKPIGQVFSEYTAETMRITHEGNVGIGTSLPNAKLSVNGKIRAHELKVESNPNTWPDYVFRPSYRLMPLNKVEDYIKTNGHLPEVPSAKEVEEKGIEVGANQALLLKKIEELTLHIIEQDKRINKLEKTLNQK